MTLRLYDCLKEPDDLLHRQCHFLFRCRLAPSSPASVTLSAGRMARHGARVPMLLPVLPEIIVVLRFQAFCHENGFSGSFRFLGLATFFFSGARFDACFLAHFIGLGQQRPLLPQPPTRANASTLSHRWLDFTHPQFAWRLSQDPWSSARGPQRFQRSCARFGQLYPARRIRLVLCMAYLHLYGRWHSIVRHAHLPRSVRCSTKS